MGAGSGLAILILLWDRTRSLGIALVLLGFVATLAILCEAALLALIPSFRLPAEQGPLRLGFTAIALVVSVALRPLVLGREEAPPDRLVFAAAMPALVVPLTIVALPFISSPRTGSELRMASLQAEDATAWVSQAFATLRLGHTPTTGIESEYVDYPRTSATTGTILEILASGRPPATRLVTATMDAVFGSWILCGVILGIAALVVQLLLLPRGSEGFRGDRIAATLLEAFIIQLAAWSLVLLLTDPQHLSLAWAGSGAAALAVVLTAVGRVPSIGLAACLTLVLVMTAASTAWPFGLGGFVLAAMGFSFELWRTIGRRAAPIVASLALGLMPGASSGLDALRSVGPTTLLGAEGGRLPVPLSSPWGLAVPCSSRSRHPAPLYGHGGL